MTTSAERASLQRIEQKLDMQLAAWGRVCAFSRWATATGITAALAATTAVLIFADVIASPAAVASIVTLDVALEGLVVARLLRAHVVWSVLLGLGTFLTIFSAVYQLASAVSGR